MVLLGAPGETWPVWDGRPMWPLCQITDNKAHINIVDSGDVYVGWSPTQGWMLTWQCM